MHLAIQLDAMSSTLPDVVLRELSSLEPKEEHERRAGTVTLHGVSQSCCPNISKGLTDAYHEEPWHAIIFTEKLSWTMAAQSQQEVPCCGISEDSSDTRKKEEI